MTDSEKEQDNTNQMPDDSNISHNEPPSPSPESILKHVSAMLSNKNSNEPPLSRPSKRDVEFCKVWADYWRYVIGVNVIPADTRNKITVIGWKKYKNSSVPNWQHEQWIKDGAFAKGMALIPGRAWHRNDKIGQYLVCLDADRWNAILEICTRNGKTIPLQELAQKFLVEQHKDNTDKAHIYFYSPIPFPKKSPDSILGLEVKGLGEHGIVYCSPSTHKNGYPYEIIGTIQPITLNTIQARELVQHLNQICIEYGVQYLDKVSIIDRSLKDMVKTLTINHTIKVHLGQRHSTLISLADSLLFNHLAGGKKNESQLKNFFDRVNEELCDPPLSWVERDSIWESALDFVDRIGTHVRANIKKSVNNENESGNDLVVSMAEKIMRNHTFATMNDSGEIYYYDVHRGVYIQGGEVLVETKAEEYENRISTIKVAEIANKIRRRTYVSRTEFDKDLEVFNLKNGLYNFKADRFTPHTADYLSIVQLPINYDPNAKCRNVLRFLGQVLRPKDVFTVLQLFGYCLYRTAKYEKAGMFCGIGDNGKGTLIKLFERFLGDQNVSHASIQELNNDRFAIADLHGKLANVCADLKAEKLTNTGTFKMLVSGDTIRAQKKHGQPFDFRNTSKQIFSANEIPESSDQTYAYFKRWLVFLFDKIFQGEDKDINLIDKLSTDEELSGLLNLAIIGLRYLIKENSFLRVDDVNTVQREYNKNANVMEDFLDNQCRTDLTDRNNYTICRDLYHSYILHCKHSNKPPVSDNVFGSHLIAKGIRKERRMLNRIREYCYVGISVSNDGSIA
jgi:putative DNA primase/helicase